MEGSTTRRTLGAALALGIGLSSGGPAPGAGAQPQQQPEVAPCRVQRGDRHVHGDTSAALGGTSLGACARAIRAGSGTGTWGPYEVEVDADGRVRVNGEEVGVLRGGTDDGPAHGGDAGRG